MIRRISIFAALLFVAKFSVAQNSQQPSPRSFNSIFDSLIINDNFFIPVSEYKDSLIHDVIPVRDSLVYNPDHFYMDHLQPIFDSPNYTDKEKIEFIKRALLDTQRRSLLTVETEVIEFWKKNDEARLLMDNYFKEQHCESKTDPAEHYRHFKFIIKNDLPGSIELIEEYINNRPSLKIKYQYENELAYRLIKAGKERCALEFMQLVVADYIADENGYLDKGWRDEDTNVFDLLCFSNNGVIRNEARALLWSCLYRVVSEGLPHTDLFELAWYLNEKDANDYLQKRFQYWKTLNLDKPGQFFTSCSGAPLGGPRTTMSYFYFMRAYSPWLIKTIGDDFWAELETRKTYIDHYWGNRYLSQIREENAKFTKQKHLDIHELVADLKQFEPGISTQKQDLIENSDFKYSLPQYAPDFFSVLRQTGLTYQFPYYANSYSSLFSTPFKAFLAKKGITDIDAQESVTPNNGRYLHQVIIRSNETAYMKESFTQEIYTNFQPAALAKMVNLLLMKKKIKERLILINGNGSVEYGLFEPEKLKLLLNKYNIHCYDLDKVTKL